MAALAHSLKTPLALMKIRCDSARNEALPRSRRDANLLRINDGLDQLLEMIENGLEAFRPGRGRIPRAEVGAAFFTALEEELLPALEAEGRPLVVDLAAGPFRANPGALRAGLSILLENALIHGQGEIRLSTRRRGRLVEVAVSDEGRGIPAVALTGMLHGGTPPEGKPAPIRPSQGLGLHLLYSLATREAWGLVFHTEPGFQVVLEVQAR
jgi:two-component system sensor histidine kinase QseC